MAFSRNFNRSQTFSEILIINHSKFEDHRGYIWTTFDKSIFENVKTLEKLHFSHDKFAKNRKGVIRGIHGDNKSYKLITIVFGEVFQVVVDCRKDSESYLNHEVINLNAEQPTSVLLPPGFGNAFCSISNTSIYHYKLAYPGNYADAEDQFSYKWDDQRIAINWPIENPILSKRDA